VHCHIDAVGFSVVDRVSRAAPQGDARGNGVAGRIDDRVGVSVLIGNEDSLNCGCVSQSVGIFNLSDFGNGF